MMQLAAMYTAMSAAKVDSRCLDILVCSSATVSCMMHACFVKQVQSLPRIVIYLYKCCMYDRVLLFAGNCSILLIVKAIL